MADEILEPSTPSQTPSSSTMPWVPTAKLKDCQSEVLDLIVEALFDQFPAKNPTPIAIRQNHPATRALRNLAEVASFLYVPATKYLYKRCLYIDSFARMDQLVSSLQAMNERYHQREGPIESTDFLYFPSNSKHRNIPTLDVCSQISSLCLKPWEREERCHVPPLLLFEKLFDLVAPSLTRLFLSSSEHSSWYDLLRLERPSFHQLLRSLSSLEVFCCLHWHEVTWCNPERTAGCLEPTCHFNYKLDEYWPNIRLIALTDVELSCSTNLLSWFNMPKLQRLVAFQTDVGNIIPDIKQRWRMLSSEHGRRENKSSILFLDVVSGDYHNQYNGQEQWTSADNLDFWVYNLPDEEIPPQHNFEGTLDMFAIAYLVMEEFIMSGKEAMDGEELIPGQRG